MNFHRREDVIYGRDHGMALTLDVFSPLENGKGLGLIFVVSGGWASSHAKIAELGPRFIEPFVDQGYTVFAVVPRSRPRFTIPDMLRDVQRSIRFVRHHATQFAVDAGRLGLYGVSAGGHLALMAGLTSDAGEPDAADLVERNSSQIQAVAEFYGPTDFFNYGAPGVSGVGQGALEDLQSAFDFCELNLETDAYQRVTDEDRRRAIARNCSPLYSLHAAAPPILIIHGDADQRVPLQQSRSFLENSRQVGASVELKIVPGVAHGWDDMRAEVDTMIDWFDANL